MVVDCLALIDVIRRNFSVELAKTSHALREAPANPLRRVLSGTPHLPGQEGIETDLYDSNSCHVVVLRRRRERSDLAVWLSARRRDLALPIAPAT